MTTPTTPTSTHDGCWQQEAAIHTTKCQVLEFGTWETRAHPQCRLRAFVIAGIKVEKTELRRAVVHVDPWLLTEFLWGLLTSSTRGTQSHLPLTGKTKTTQQKQRMSAASYRAPPLTTTPFQATRVWGFMDLREYEFSWLARGQLQWSAWANGPLAWIETRKREVGWESEREVEKDIVRLRIRVESDKYGVMGQGPTFFFLLCIYILEVIIQFKNFKYNELLTIGICLYM